MMIRHKSPLYRGVAKQWKAFAAPDIADLPHTEGSYKTGKGEGYAQSRRVTRRFLAESRE
jgi:hypothetical protein